MMLDTPSKPNIRKKQATPTPSSSSKNKFQSINGTESKAVLNDVSYNHYGRRIATCSSDRTVRVWDYMNTKDEWVSNYELTKSSNVHEGCVTRVCWCHPEYGQLVATCSEFDNIVCIWQERGGKLTTCRMSSTWDVQATLSDAKLPIYCIQFAPYHLGLKIVTGSADGTIRIYEACDLRDYKNWEMQSAFNVNSCKEDVGVTCLSWCTKQFEPPTLVIGTSNGKVLVYRYNDSSRHWFMAASLNNDNKGSSISDVSWATKLGRKHHTIASIDDDGVLIVYRITPDKNSENPYALCVESSQILSNDESYDESTEYRKRCGWNTTGKILASSCCEDDIGIVQLWEESLVTHEWKCVSKVFDNYMEYQF